MPFTVMLTPCLTNPLSVTVRATELSYASVVSKIKLPLLDPDKNSSPSIGLPSHDQSAIGFMVTILPVPIIYMQFAFTPE